MAWAILIVAGIFEVIWAVALKYSEGFTKLWPSVIFIIAAWLSFACLSLALKHIPMGSAYAVWTGIGAVGIAIIGMVWFSEPATLFRIACIALIVIGIAGLKLSGSEVNAA
jgi:quaternary ammonium compound-resistance protein SugE